MCWGSTWRALESLLRLLCCSPRRAGGDDPAARLLHADQQPSAPAGVAADHARSEESSRLLGEPALNASAGADVNEECDDSSQGGTIVVMRHGHRQDEEDRVWHRTAKRPWDPPLSKKGRVQARQAAAAMRTLGVEVVVTSPFRRCLQTSAEIVAEMGLPQGAWQVDWGLSEVCDPRVLFSGRPDVAGWTGKKEITRWMWDGLSIEEALASFIQHDGPLSKVAIQPELMESTSPPTFPENLEKGLQRYQRRIQAAMRAFPGKHVLLVTHGEAVRQAVVMYDPQAEVYEVKHTGYVYMQRPVGEAGTWQLCSIPGDSGVMWIE